jgi:hypothetical protein
MSSRAQTRLPPAPLEARAAELHAVFKRMAPIKLRECDALVLARCVRLHLLAERLATDETASASDVVRAEGAAKKSYNDWMHAARAAVINHRERHGERGIPSLAELLAQDRARAEASA